MTNGSMTEKVEPGAVTSSSRVRDSVDVQQQQYKT
jgi:hypothetical protein